MRQGSSWVGSVGWFQRAGLFLLLLAGMACVGRADTTLFMPLSDQTGLDSSRYSLYVLGFSSTSKKALLPVSEGFATDSSLSFQTIDNVDTGFISSYKIGAGGAQQIKMVFPDTLTKTDTEAVNGARIYFFVADKTIFPDTPRIEYLANFGVMQPGNPPYPTASINGVSVPLPPYMYVEFTYIDSTYGWVTDVSSVDGFTFPISIALNGAAPSLAYSVVGQPLATPSVARDGILDAYSAFMAKLTAEGGKQYLDLRYTDNGGELLLNPYYYLIFRDAKNNFVNLGSPLNTVFDTTLDSLFAETTLSVQVPGSGAIAADIYTATPVNIPYAAGQLSHPALTFTGKTNGEVFNVFNPVGFATLAYAADGSDSPITGSVSGKTLTFDATLPAGALQAGLYVMGAGIGSPTAVVSLDTDGAGGIVAAQLGASFAGTAIGQYQFCKTNYSSLFVTSGAMVFGNTGLFADANVETGDRLVVLEALQGQIAMALNRGVALKSPSSGADGHTTTYWGTQTNWYPVGAAQNLFSLFMHTGVAGAAATPIYTRASNAVASARGSIMGMSYGFAYDENPSVPAGQPQVPSKWDPVPSTAYKTMTVTLGPWVSSAFTITATSGAHGAITPSGAVTVDSGANQSFAIDADAGYQIADVLVDGLSVGTPTTYTFTAVAANHTIAASFRAISPTVFVITATADANGTINPSGEVSVDSGADQAFAIAADSGYKIAGVLVDGASVGAVTSYTFTNVVAHHSIEARFEPIPVTKFTIAAAAGAHGEITPSGSIVVDSGATQHFAIDADAGYQIANVVVDGVSIGTPVSHTFANVAANHTIAATFKAIPPDVFVITATAGMHGTITPTGEVAVSSGASQAFSIAAASGYKISAVLVDGASVGAVTSYTFANVTASHTILASFEAIPVTKFTITATAGANGTITPSGAVSVDSGASQSFAIAANSGYQVAAVLVDGISQGALTSYEFKAVTANHTIAASFVPVTKFTITATAGANGTITPSGAVSVDSGASQSFAVAADSGYEISAVLVDGISQGVVASYEFKAVAANHTIAARFVAIPVVKHTITATAGANGTITPSGAVSVDSGASQSFAIAANSGYHIAGVSVDGVSQGTPSSYDFTDVTANHTITASFASDVLTHQVTFIAPANGTLSDAAYTDTTIVQTVVDGGSCLAVAAVPDSGYYFDKWTGTDSPTFDNPLLIENVTKDMVVTAVFVDQPVFHVAPGSVFIYNVETPFTQKPKVAVGKVAAKVLSKSSEFKTGVAALRCQWTSVKLVPALYTLDITNKTVAYATAYFNIEQPSLTAVSTDTAVGDSPITVVGKFFGSAKPSKVYMSYVDTKTNKTKNLSCKVAKPTFVDANDKLNKSYMNVDTGVSLLTFTVPKKITADMEATLHLEFKFAEPLTYVFNKQ